MKSGEIVTILAEYKGDIVGYATIHRSLLRWTAHVAELRVMVAESMRGAGLGRVLTQEAFANALAGGIEKMVAQMTLDQKGAIATFEGLGFRPEALLRDQVKDRQGNKHDLLVLSHEVAKFEAQRAAYGVNQAFE
jgi:L-amino acid N-acyltransferase YncA